jgi:chorismate dehydratase
MIIAKIPFINSVPYFHFLSSRWQQQHQLVKGDPRKLGELARSGKVDAGLFSLADALPLVAEGGFEWLGALGIAGFGPIQSILLCGARDPSFLGGKSIGISPQTATTVKLLEIWLTQKLALEPVKFTSLDDPAAAAQLLIGDQALRRKLDRGDSEAQIDLCDAWSQWTGLPFVFARWAVRKDLPPRDKKELLVSLSSALDLAMDDLPHVCGEVADNEGLPPAAIEAYLKGIRYRLGPEELKGAGEFQRRLGLL